MLTIAIDFDDTLTADAALWREFIDSAHRLGHRVICVTCRRKTDENRAKLAEWFQSHGIAIPLYFTNLDAKIEDMKRRDIKVDVWIDDDPGCVVNGK
jgi:GTP-binding protein EngB required for normal cell division